MDGADNRTIERKSVQGRKDKVVHARFNAGEFAEIERAAEAAKMTVSAFMRSLTLEGAGVRPFFDDDDRAVLGLLHAEMRRVGINLNQLALVANKSGVTASKRISNEIADIQKILASVMLELRVYAERGHQKRRGGG
ncbi:plasmid mobilization relaxosome protein MobC [Ensifer sp. YR511]|uniref:plasmid mobilization protein n=1 Tax=Ensifer sp. YR511 TaxID=1855294 RepID=UPI0008811FD3|nr:plasmid mobilization relaxosome protein MobC [Ensifer sp. YR511]SDN95406.1 mobilisation protein (MobC) [Ensifer sp. YR511]